MGERLRRLTPRGRWQRLRLVLCLDVAAVVLFLACAAPQPQGWMASRGPVVPHDSFPGDCSLCHTTGSWTELRDDFAFDHEAETGVALVGAHAQAQCLRCHNDRGPVAKFASRGCAGCHEDIHLGALGPRCEECHVQTDWMPQGITAEHAKTRFPLVGAHVATACQSCHPGSEAGVFQPAPVRCEDCHQSDLASATDPNHVALGWTMDCQRCHQPTAWGGEGFVHTAWPLTGAHAAASCESCHAGGVFVGTPRDCFACHASEFQSASDPNHVLNNFPTNCALCHDTSGWEGAEFDHQGVTGNCANCHLDEYQQTSDPNHAASGFPQTCELCHGTNSWTVNNFAHPGITGNCVDCHLPEYQATSNPNHAALGIPTSCEDCHQVTGWGITNFSHPGASAVSNCSACHLEEYQATTSPNHAASGFPTTCESCHVSTVNWQQAQFQHTFRIGPGSDHSGISCNTCHSGGPPGPPNCLQCHPNGEMGKRHQGIPGYVWSSPACISCHPTGERN